MNCFPMNKENYFLDWEWKGDSRIQKLGLILSIETSFWKASINEVFHKWGTFYDETIEIDSELLRHWNM